MTVEHADSPLLTAARAWYDAGYAVIPTHEDGSKRPFGQWKEFQHQRPSIDDVEQWMRSGRHTGIGVITGAASAHAELIEIEGPMDAAVERLGRVITLAQDYHTVGMPDLLARIARGCVEQSAGGGLHLFIRVTDGPAKGNTKLAHADGKVVSETRGEGGFVVVAPTPARNGHPDGAVYMFINGGHPANTIDVTSEERDMLHLLFTLALDETPAEPADSPQPPRSHSTPPSDGLSAFDDYRQRVTWRDILTPHGWTHAHHDGERDHWVRPGKTIHEGTSATTIEDGPLYVFTTSTGLPAETGLSKGQAYAWLNHGGDPSTAARALIAAGFGDPRSYNELPAWEAQLDPDATETEREEAAASWVREHLPLIDWQQLWQDETEEEWIVEPLLAKRRLVALYSAPKVGKSLLMLELAAAMASGKPVLGNAAVPPIRTLYVDFENDPRGDIRERLRDMGYGPDDLTNLCYLSFPTIAKLDTKNGADQLLAAIDEYACQVVVVDTVSRAVSGDENENDTWLNFYRHTGLRLKQAEVALIRLDHSGKDETKGQRGGSAKSGDVDAVWRMSKIGDNTFRLACEANRFPIREKLVDLERIEDPVLRHKRDMQAYKRTTDEIIAKFAKAGIPRDGSATVRGTKETLRAAGITFPNGAVNKATLAEYCRRLPTFDTPELAAG